MSNALILLDSSILCEILCVPGKFDKHSGVLEQFKKYKKRNDEFFTQCQQTCYEFYLPLATIIETGNHIGQIDDGNIRRQRAELFVEFVKKALMGETPFRLLKWELSEMKEWIDSFPDFTTRQNGGIGDLSIVKEYERLRDQPPSNLPIKIWSKDTHLSSYRRNWEEER